MGIARSVFNSIKDMIPDKDASGMESALIRIEEDIDDKKVNSPDKIAKNIVNTIGATLLKLAVEDEELIEPAIQKFTQKLEDIATDKKSAKEVKKFARERLSQFREEAAKRKVLQVSVEDEPEPAAIPSVDPPPDEADDTSKALVVSTTTTRKREKDKNKRKKTYPLLTSSVDIASETETPTEKILNQLTPDEIKYLTVIEKRVIRGKQGFSNDWLNSLKQIYEKRGDPNYELTTKQQYRTPSSVLSYAKHLANAWHTFYTLGPEVVEDYESLAHDIFKALPIPIATTEMFTTGKNGKQKPIWRKFHMKYFPSLLLSTIHHAKHAYRSENPKFAAWLSKRFIPIFDDLGIDYPIVG